MSASITVETGPNCHIMVQSITLSPFRGPLLPLACPFMFLLVGRLTHASQVAMVTTLDVSYTVADRRGLVFNQREL